MYYLFMNLIIKWIFDDGKKYYCRPGKIKLMEIQGFLRRIGTF